MRIEDAHLMLLFVPGLCEPRDPLEVLEAALPSIDVVQVRPKNPGSSDPCDARESYDWGVRVLDLAAARPDLEIAVMIDDRVDVAIALRSRGCAGVHLGQSDCPPRIARDRLGGTAWIGWSTHGPRQVGEAEDLPVDYIGFGPVHATATKGYEHGLGSEAVWVASLATNRPLFPIGGIDATNVGELARVGRAAVGSAILRAEDPARAARELRSLLLG
jgi:thiamine-phosphate pyrophosphorylase